ncbi:DUF7620 family protein [Georgenia faecalis]|uniref:DUF7620 family protein n=1 Tax=Georgenia faecalis TaxID=2483799 RepID=UPI000FDCB9B2|nr:hypothetical protein [Georgenia faecalis]
MIAWLGRRHAESTPPPPPPRIEEARAAMRASEKSLQDAQRRWVSVNRVAGAVDVVLVDNHIAERLHHAFKGE